MAIPGKVPCSSPRAPFLPGDQEQARPLPSSLTGLLSFMAGDPGANRHVKAPWLLLSKVGSTRGCQRGIYSESSGCFWILVPLASLSSLSSTQILSVEQGHQPGAVPLLPSLAPSRRWICNPTGNIHEGR